MIFIAIVKRKSATDITEPGIICQRKAGLIAILTIYKVCIDYEVNGF